MAEPSMVELGLAPVLEGKVRQLYAVDDERLVMVASDRISAFDVVMDQPIPDKGRVLTAMSAYWCSALAEVAPGSQISCDPELIEVCVPGFLACRSVHGRATLVRRAQMLPMECIVRGYLAGQAYEEYAASGTIHTMAAPPGLRLAERLPEPMFTPSTKAEQGHDLNIGLQEAERLVGAAVLQEAMGICLGLYRAAAQRCEAAGLVLADTKFELGFVDGRLVLCDEVVTPDSSRIWPADGVVVGQSPPAFDKQPFRDWLSSLDWDKQPPPPSLPVEVIAETSARYRAAYERVTGLALEDWYGRST
jgi:phosphoribosylaminoimidazole-succinocarboxamide synthase